MTDKDIFDLADNYADWDDFGRWVFRDSDKLLQFAEELLSVETKPETSTVSERQEPVYVDSSRFPRGPLDHKPGTVIVKPVHAIDISQERVDETEKCGHEQCLHQKVHEISTREPA
jgi:hypothetical protein